MSTSHKSDSSSQTVEQRAMISWLQLVEKVPTVLLQALVTPTRATQDGDIVRVLQPAWALIIAMLRDDPNALHTLSPRQFEELIAATYDKAGFDEVILTPRSADLGRDVIAIKHGWGSVRIIDQAKCYKPGHLVDANDVRALLGVLHADRNATKAIVSTSSDFAPRIATDPFIAPFIPHRLELVNGTDMKQRLAQLGAA